MTTDERIIRDEIFKINREEVRRLIREVKKECTHCKSKNRLTFHHIDPIQKVNDICKLFLHEAKEEIKKCIVLCERCHENYHKGILTIRGLPLIKRVRGSNNIQKNTYLG